MTAEIPILDLRQEQEPDDRRTRVRRGRTVMRDPSTITGIVLHQTACRYGVTRKALERAGRDRRLALARRVVHGVGKNPGVPAHAIAMREGFVVWPFDLRAYCYHAHALNASTLGLEVEGLYSGLLDDPSSIPDEARRTTPGGSEPDELDELTIATARAALRFLVERGRQEGMPLEFVYAHRQSRGDRRADPGEAIWQVMEQAARALGLRADHRSTWTSGRPIPRAWSSAAAAPY